MKIWEYRAIRVQVTVRDHMHYRHTSLTSWTIEVDVVDQFLSQENEEFEALVSSIQDRNNRADKEDNSQLNYGSDDEEYDALFIQIAPEGVLFEAHAGDASRLPIEQGQEMDVSTG